MNIGDSFDPRAHPAWPDLVQQLGERRRDVGYLAVVPSGDEVQLAPRFDWTPQTCGAYGAVPGNDLDDAETFGVYTEAVAAWLGRLVLDNAVPGLRRSYRVRVFLPKGAEYLFSVAFPVHHAGAPPPPEEAPSGPARSVAFRPGPAAILGDGDDDRYADAPGATPGDVRAQDVLPGDGDDEAEDDEGEGEEDGDEGEDEDTPIVFRSSEEAVEAGRTVGRRKAGKKVGKAGKRRKGRVSVRAAAAAFAPIRIDEHMLDIDLPDMEDFDPDEAIDVADATVAQMFAGFALLHKATRAHLMLVHASTATHLQIVGRQAEALAEALEKQTGVTLSLVEVIADEKLTRAETEAAAEKDAGKRVTIERLGGQAIKTTGDLLRAKAVLDKVDRIDGATAADLALKGTSLEGIGAAAGAVAEAEGPTVADIEEVVERVKPPPPAGYDDIAALLTARPWIAEGLRDSRLLDLLRDPESLNRIRMAAPFLGNPDQDTVDPGGAPSSDAPSGEGTPE